MSRAVNNYLGTRWRSITRVVKGELEKLTEDEQDDNARDERLPKLVFCVDSIHYFLVFIVYSSF